MPEGASPHVPSPATPSDCHGGDPMQIYITIVVPKEKKSTRALKKTEVHLHNRSYRIRYTVISLSREIIDSCVIN